MKCKKREEINECNVISFVIGDDKNSSNNKTFFAFAVL